MRLYYVNSAVEEYDGFKNVNFTWFRCDKSEDPRPYAELIDNFDPGGELDPEFAIDEMFTESEATALKAYLDEEHGNRCVTTIEEADLPIPNNTMALSAVPLGGGQDCLMLYREPAYNLPFKVEGYYDLRGCEAAAQNGKRDKRYWRTWTLAFFIPKLRRAQTTEELATLLADNEEDKAAAEASDPWLRDQIADALSDHRSTL